MLKNGIILLLCFVFSFQIVNAKEPFLANIPGNVLVGIGTGFDYGGMLGGNLTYEYNHNLGAFVGSGLTYAGVGYNVGVRYRANRKSDTPRFAPYAIAMYGYNTMLSVENQQSLNRLFYGPSVGIGLDYFINPKESRTRWSLALLVPIRNNSTYDNYLQEKQIVLQSRLSPVAFSLGYFFDTK
ncbi:MAG: hypothetical protein Q8909_02125 [Bacteroidota bacterium]|nr:hypothetical protein [Bacteroidota bacterium]